MKTFILIIMLKTANAGGAASAEFSDLEACEAAKGTIEAEYKSALRGVTAWCFPAESE